MQKFEHLRYYIQYLHNRNVKEQVKAALFYACKIPGCKIAPKESSVNFGIFIWLIKEPLFKITDFRKLRNFQAGPR